nr:hypothetical protein [Tanacetum cinerariifolium]
MARVTVPAGRVGRLAVAAPETAQSVAVRAIAGERGDQCQFRPAHRPARGRQSDRAMVDRQRSGVPLQPRVLPPRTFIYWADV